jgi:hypothetical protein
MNLKDFGALGDLISKRERSWIKVPNKIVKNNSKMQTQVKILQKFDTIINPTPKASQI